MSRNDQILVKRLRARDEDAFVELVKAYQHTVFNIVFRILGNRAEAEDVAQEVFVSIFKHIEGFRGDAKFSTWVYRISTNHARNRLKYLGRRSHRDHQNYEDSPDGVKEVNPLSGDLPKPDEAMMGRELERIIKEGLEELNDIHRTIIVLRDIEHLSYAEIGEIVDLPEGTVKSRLFRARAALKDYVQRRYDG